MAKQTNCHSLLPNEAMQACNKLSRCWRRREGEKKEGEKAGNRQLRSRKGMGRPGRANTRKEAQPRQRRSREGTKARSVGGTAGRSRRPHLTINHKHLHRRHDLCKLRYLQYLRRQYGWKDPPPPHPGYNAKNHTIPHAHT